MLEIDNLCVAGAVLQSPPSLIDLLIHKMIHGLWKYLHWLLIGPQIA